MKKFFKRFLSSVLATVMTVSVLSIGMATNVFAADNFAEVWPNNASGSTLTSLKTSGLSSSASSINMDKLEFDDGYSFTKDATTGDAVTTFGMSAVKREKASANTAFTITPSVSGTAKIYAYANSTSDSTAKVTQGTSSVVTDFALAKKSATTANVLTFDVTANLEYSIVATKEIHVIAMGIVQKSTGEKYTWSVDSSNLTGFEGSVTVTAETDSKNTVVSYSGTDYVLKSEYKSITDTTSGVTAGTEDNSYIVTPEVSWFVPTRTVEFTETSGNDTTITLTGTLGYSYDVDISATANKVILPEDTYTVKVNSGEIDPTTLTVNSDTTSAEFTYTPATSLTNISLVDSFNASDLTVGDITSNTAHGKFTLIADSSNYFTVDSNSKKANGLSITNRLKTNGTSSTTKRAIKFTTTEANTTLYVWALSGSSSARTLNVWNASGSVVGTIAAPGSGDISNDTIPGGSVVLDSVGDYYVGSSGSGINIYLLGTDKALAGSTSEDTTETTTEATTTAPDDNAITDKATLTFDALVDADTDTTTNDVKTGYFTIIAGSSSAVESNSFTFDGLGEYTSRYKTGGKTTISNNVPSNRAIKFATADAAVVQIAARATSDKSRSLNIYDSSGNVYNTTTKAFESGASSLTTSDTDGHIITAILPKADTYYIAATEGYGIFSINVVVDETIADATNNGKVFTDTTDAYLIASVTAAEVADTNNSEVSISVGNNTAVTSGEVYKAAIIDGQYVTAEELGADFIYVVKAVGAAFDNVKDFVVSFVTAE